MYSLLTGSRSQYDVMLKVNGVAQTCVYGCVNITCGEADILVLQYTSENENNRNK